MTRFILYLLMAMPIAGCYPGASVIPEVYKSRILAAIDLCRQAGQSEFGEEFLSEVDRVTVLASPTQIEMIFAFEELGAFGPRSPDYFPYLGCGVEDSGLPLIYYLSEPRKDPVIKLPDVVAMNDKSSWESNTGKADLWYSLFVRTNDEFKFVSTLPYDPNEGLSIEYGE